VDSRIDDVRGLMSADERTRRRTAFAACAQVATFDAGGRRRLLGALDGDAAAVRQDLSGSWKW